MDGLSNICNGLGILEEDDDGNCIGYDKREYCSDNLKDLLRFLRRDDPEKRDVFKQVCKWNIVGKDLIPIIEFCQEERSLVLNAVKVLVFLTMPVESTSIDIPQQIEYLWRLKAAITPSTAVPVIVSLLETPLENLENESFTDDDWKLVQLVLTLFRNILAIQDISPQQKAGGLANEFLSLRDKFLELLFQENVMDLILVLSQHTGGSHGYLRQDNMLLLEIFYYMFKGQDPELIVKSYFKGSKVEEDAEKSLTSLQAMNKEEWEKRKLIRMRNINCYRQFSGTFTKMTLDGSKALCKGNPCSSGNALLKAHRNQRGPSKRMTWDHDKLPSTRNQILNLFYGFITQFLVGGYNALMQSIREDIEKDHEQIQSSDVIIFFYVARFVMSFQHYKCVASKPNVDVDKESVTCNDDDTLFNGTICGPVSETLNESMFLMVISKWRYAFECLKQTNDYMFLSAAGSVVKTMIRMLDLVLKQAHKDSKEPQTARILLYKLFYDQTDEGMIQFLLNLIKSFDTHKQSKSDLADLVESMHVVLRLIESLQARGTLRVSKKSRKKKKIMTKDEHLNEVNGSTSVDNATTNNEAGGSICVDATTHNVVGASSCQDSADVMTLDSEILTKQDCDGDLDEGRKDSILSDEPLMKPANEGRNELDAEENMADDIARAYLGSDNSSGDEQQLLTEEVDFKVSSLVSALANNTIIQNLCWLLKFYKSNSLSTNHYILGMLRRICDDLELSPMLYQLSLLTIFYDILEEQKLRPCKDYENIVTFLASFVRRMLRKMKSYPLLLVEVLFWKTRKECHYISCGSMLNELNSMKKGYGGGKSGSASGGIDFSEGQGWAPRSIADALGDDDFAESHEYGQEKGQSAEDEPARMSEGGNDLTLNDEMQGRLEDLYDKYKGDLDFCELIARDLNPNGEISEKQVSKALKQLGLKAPAKRNLLNSCVGYKNREISTACDKKNLTIPDESSCLREPKRPKKGVHAFTADQEQKIRDLFKQFHDHKRCSHMIAKALDMDGMGEISANRISRKLKQLGLVVPKKNRNSNNKHSDDVKGSSDPSPQSAGESDDDRLLSLKRRGKHNRKRSHDSEKHSQKIARKLSEDMSDDELLSALVCKQKRNGSHTDEKHSQKIARKLSKDLSDDELLSALVKTNKTPRRSADEEPMVDSVERNFAESNSDGSDTEVSERNSDKQANETSAFEEDTSNVGRSDTETGTIGMDSPNASDGKTANSEHPVLDDDLVDEMTDDANKVPVTMQENSVPRRRMRMVINSDDDE